MVTIQYDGSAQKLARAIRLVQAYGGSLRIRHSHRTPTLVFCDVPQSRSWIDAVVNGQAR